MGLSDRGWGPWSTPGWRPAFWSGAVGLGRRGGPRWFGAPTPVHCRPTGGAWCEKDAGSGSEPPLRPSEWAQAMESSVAWRRWDAFDSLLAVLAAHVGASVAACLVAGRVARRAGRRRLPGSFPTTRCDGGYSRRPGPHRESPSCDTTLSGDS